MDADEFVIGVCEALSAANAVEREKTYPMPDVDPSVLDGLTEAQRLLLSMLTENTGAHLLDSGDIYGRNWETWRQRLASGEIMRPLRWEYDELNDTPCVYLTRDLFEALSRVLKVNDVSRIVDTKLQELWRGMYDRYDALSELNVWLHEQGFDFVFGAWSNTYNGEHMLSQDFEISASYPYEYADGKPPEDACDLYGDPFEAKYAIISTHNGCDIRGGYSTPHVFALDTWDGLTDLFDLMTVCRAVCMKCGTGWDTDDAGSHWYCDKMDEDMSAIDRLADREYWLPVYEDNGVLRHRRCGGEVVFEVYPW